MRWLKYRYKSSADIGDWEYWPLYDDSDEYIEESLVPQLDDQGEWLMEHGYRGMDWEIVEHDQVPKEVVDEVIESLRRKIENARECLKFFGVSE